MLNHGRLPMNDDDSTGPESEDVEIEPREPSREELVNFISEFMASSLNVEQVYRSHLVETVAARVYSEFGQDGLCDLMMKIDERANWISDIIIEQPDLDDVMFKRHGVYDHQIMEKARKTDALLELNQKIWRLRKKYARAIVDELFESSKPTFDPILEDPPPA
tara:strand:- start:6374 stop:6862 length:489 start_codon:yes stop_codon:yes gene_type:complete